MSVGHAGRWRRKWGCPIVHEENGRRAWHLLGTSGGQAESVFLCQARFKIRPQMSLCHIGDNRYLYDYDQSRDDGHGEHSATSHQPIGVEIQQRRVIASAEMVTDRRRVGR